MRSALPGVVFVGAYVRTPSGSLVGPAVWRFLEPGGAFPNTQLDLSANSNLARQLTPSTGYITSSTEDPVVATARRCAAHAR